MEDSPTPSNGEAETDPDAPIQLIISMFPDGRINVSGPIGNKAMAYSMLELARDAIYEYHHKQKANRIVPPQGFQMPPGFRGRS